MHLSRRTLSITVVITFVFFILLLVKLPYYIYKPGEANELSQMVEVENGEMGEGEFHLVTVSGTQATVLQYVLAKVSTYQEVMPLEDALPEGYTDEEYHHFQMKMMESSHNAAKVVAYKAANERISIEDNGVFVLHVMDQMPAYKKVEVGDRIIEVDGQPIKEANDLVTYVQSKNSGDKIEVVIEREQNLIPKKIEVKPFPNDRDKVGIGIQLYTDKKVTVEREVEIKSGQIGGPSAGIMFALAIYDQLMEEDITKGYEIAGTGEIDFEGNVLRIGGVDKKVVAADRDGIDIFFVPYEEGVQGSNYEVAKETAEAIKSDMEIVPIDTFSEAVDYLKKRNRK